LAIELPDLPAPDSIHKDPPPAQARRRSILLTVIALLLAGFFLFLAFRGVDWSAFWGALYSGRYEFLLLTIPISTASYYLRSIRWGVFVRAEKKIPIQTIFWANMVGYLGNSILPARAGEWVRSALLGGEGGIGTSFILATVLAERIFDVIALMLIGSMAFLLQAVIPGVLTTGLMFMAVVGGIGLVAFLMAPYFEKSILGFLEHFQGYPRVFLFLRTQITRFLGGMRTLHDPRRLTSIVLLTGVIWLMDAFSTTIGVRIIHQTLTIGHALVLLAALGLSSAIPSTPGYVGPYQFAAVTVLVPFGFSQAEALAFILISQVRQLFLVGFWGLIGAWKFRSVLRTSAQKSQTNILPESEAPTG